MELATEIEKRGFTGIYCPSMSDGMALCEALAFATNEIPFGTSIAPIYTRPVLDHAQTTAFIHEVSGGRFSFGIGISHGPSMARMGRSLGKPLTDTRNFIEEYNAVERVGEKPPIVLATLRKKMIALAGEIGAGMVFANAARSHIAESLSALPDAKRNDKNFYIGNMIPTCISDDIEAAKAVNRRTLTSYVQLPNYQNYWREAGYVEEMDAIAAAVEAGEADRIPSLMSDKVARRHDTIRFGVGGSRRCRGVARGGCTHADPGAKFRRRESDEGVQGNVRRLRLIPRSLYQCSLVYAIPIYATRTG